MIERYSITSSAQQIRDRFSVDVPDFYAPHYNAAPTQLLPVITLGSKGLSLFYWGTSPEWSKNKVLSEKIINLPSENFVDKPSLKKSLKKNRCVIPADGFYAWKKVGKKTSIPYRFTQTTKDLFGFAGLWEEFEDTDGNQIQTFTIITAKSNALVKSVQERMPVILSKQHEKVWLDKATEESDLLNVLNEVNKTAFDYYPVSPKINDIQLNVPSLILATPPADQYGNLTLFD